MFIGSDTQLVAPVTVGTGSVVAAGTTVTQNVPPDSLVISRVTQVTRPGWAAKRRALLGQGGIPSSERTPASAKKAKTASRSRGVKPSKKRTR